MDHNNTFPRKRNASSLGLGLGASFANKKSHFNMDFSALPTHLPGTNSTENASSTGIPVLASLPAKPDFSSDSKSLQTTENGPISNSHESLSINVNTTTSESVKENVTKQENSSVKSDKEPVFIEGTNITLQTEEDIAKWIAERRKKWPTRKNVEAKMQSKALEEEKHKEREVSEKKEGKDSEHASSSKQNVCKFYAKSGRCKFGNKCRNLHETRPSSTCSANNNNNNNNHTSTGSGSGSGSGSGTRKNINGVLVNIPQRYKKEVDGAGSLFTKLVQRDLYEHENNIVVDFISYLDSKGLINHDITAS